MNETIDTHLFAEIILSEGVTLMYRCEDDGDFFEYYLGLNGRKVAVCLSDEYITEQTAKEYLHLLGLSDLIDRLFFKKG
ncbi:MAG: hypothetical protein B7Y11_01245 [Sphingobacteriia bacterium 24-36-13]|jgi:hypothetical protein|uniref:hypothetical protein n=1 Tax=Sediminibacterium sp. TaxID=1917865 RepID=UPI000BCA6A13|nr:hypothetical protein [Sediminibacterium sp.]OYZ55717.1 MAG: hypothetical protein B7Y11_01245 [Sphingobacteriia bacterium 24-36-13]HQS23208.1 hypothetical protein [Sediminibacterium sp.]